MRQYRLGAHTKSDLKVHLVWIPKYRKAVLSGEVALRVRDLIRQIAMEHELEIISGKVARDHVHDGDGKRVMKSGGTIYWYGNGSDPLDETDLAGTFRFRHYYFNGIRVARREANNWVDGLDHLGNARFVYGNNGAWDVSDFYPFGGERPITSAAGNKYKFTGKERDSESGLDYFGARFDSSTLGRFTSPDPIAGRLLNPQSLNPYSYVRNNPLNLTDPTGMIVEWNDSQAKCKKGETVCRTNAQRAYEERLKQLRESKDKKEREKGEKLTESYERLQASKAVFEVRNDRSGGSNGGEITYQGNDHFTINLHGNDNYGLTDNQRLAHEFEHGRQVLDGELSFHNYVEGKWLPFAHDRTDEAKAFEAGFDIERSSPGLGTFINSIQQAIDTGGVLGGATRLGRGDSPYRALPEGPINVEIKSPAVYRVPQ